MSTNERYFLNFSLGGSEPVSRGVHPVCKERAEVGHSWALLSPYGDWDNVQGMQRFTHEDAIAIVNEFTKNGLAQSVGLPWYIGHPDHPAFADKYTDTSAYGRIKQLEARTSGLWAKVKWSVPGQRLIKDEAFHGHSVNWPCVKRPDGNWHPARLKSVGFTNNPNIDVPPVMLANEAWRRWTPEQAREAAVRRLASTPAPEAWQAAVHRLAAKPARATRKRDAGREQIGWGW